MSEEQTTKDYRTISSMINNMGFNAREVAKKLSNDHPTLQQNFMRLVSEFIRAEAQKEHSDARNEATVEICKKLLKLMEDENMHLSYI